MRLFEVFVSIPYGMVAAVLRMASGPGSTKMTALVAALDLRLVAKHTENQMVKLISTHKFSCIASMGKFTGLRMSPGNQTFTVQGNDASLILCNLQQ